MLILYKPDDRFLFGAYEGEKIKFVYTFDPNYIAYCINEFRDFGIEIQLFKDLHTFDLLQTFPFKNNSRNALSVNGELFTLRDYLRFFLNSPLSTHYYNEPKTKNLFFFSKDTIDLLKEKLEENIEKGLLYTPEMRVLADSWAIKIDSNIDNKVYFSEIFGEISSILTKRLLKFRINPEIILSEDSKLTNFGKEIVVIIFNYSNLFQIDLSINTIANHVQKCKFKEDIVILKRLDGIYFSVVRKGYKDNNFQNLNELAKIQVLENSNI